MSIETPQEHTKRPDPEPPVGWRAYVVEVAIGISIAIAIAITVVTSTGEIPFVYQGY